MVEWKSIEELRQLYINKYEQSKIVAELENAYSLEYSFRTDYNGRQILELLQNVDDAINNSSENVDPTVRIVYKNNILEVGNMGTTFSAEAIDRICLGAASDKTEIDIGNKGIGFRSLLNNAEWIEIHSGEYHIRFSERFSNNIFREHLNNPKIKSQYDNYKKGYALSFPIMNMPEEIDPIECQYDTLIRVKVKENNENDTASIAYQLTQPFYKALLFLPNIRKIILEVDSDTRIYEKVIEKENNEVYIQDEDGEIERFYVNEKKISVENDKKSRIAVAIPIDINKYDFSQEKIYCYFPIRSVGTPVHALIHAPFITNNSRDDISFDEKHINKKLLREIIVFLKETAEKISKAGRYDNSMPITFLTPLNKDGKVWDENSFNMFGEYERLIFETTLLPNVNGKLISFSDEPKIIEGEFPEAFRGDSFSRLIAKLDKGVYDFIRALGDACNYKKFKYSDKELVECINSTSYDFDIVTAVKVFLWCSLKCTNSLKQSHLVPRLLKDSRGRWIESIEKTIYIPTETSDGVIPKSLDWVELCVVEKQYVNQLIDQIKRDYKEEWESAREKNPNDSTKRLLDHFSECLLVALREQTNSDTIIDDINGQIDSVEKSKSFINWFFENYRDSFKEGSSLYKVRYKLYDNKGNIVNSDKLYFGSENGSSLADELFHDSGCSAIAPISKVFTGSAEEKNSFIEFLKKCGVMQFPPIIEDEISYPDSFFKELEEKYHYEHRITRCRCKKIKDFKEIINRLTREQIVQWLSQDQALNELLTSDDKKGIIFSSYKTYLYNINSNEYIKYVLNTEKWIDIYGKKYSPRDIVLYQKLSDKVDGLYGISEENLVSLLNTNIIYNYKLSFANSFSMLSDNKIEAILKTLKNVDAKGEISKSIYEDIASNKLNKIPKYNNEGLEVFCQDNEYHLNSEVEYAQSTIVKQLIDGGKLVDIMPDRNAKVIYDWLGVKSSEISMIVKNYALCVSPSAFYDEINELKVSVLAYILDSNTDIRMQKMLVGKVEGIKIIPCSEIVLVNDKGQEQQLENYEYVCKDNEYLIVVPDKYEISKMRESSKYRNSILAIFDDAIGLGEKKDIIWSMVSLSSSIRKGSIESKFGREKWDEMAMKLNGALEKQKVAIRELLIDRGSEEDDISKISRMNLLKLSLNDFMLFRNICNKANVDVIDFENIGLRIDVRGLISDEFCNYRDSKFDIVMSIYYIEAKSNAKKKKNFKKFMDEYKEYSLDVSKIKNSIKVKKEELLQDYLKSTFGIDLYDVCVINYDSVYNESYQQCVNNGISKENLDEFLNNNLEAASLLYFGDYDQTMELFTDSIREEKNNNGNYIKTFDKGTSTIVEPLMPKELNTTQGRIVCERSANHYKKDSVRQELRGQEAEKLAYLELKKQYPNIIWHSKNSEVPSDRNRAPRDVSCDMWVDGEEKRYFEVKAYGDRFYMSKREYESMYINREEYEVVLANTDKATISRHAFDEIDKLKTIESYCFYFKIDEEK